MRWEIVVNLYFQFTEKFTVLVLQRLVLDVASSAQLQQQTLGNFILRFDTYAAKYL